MPVMQEATTEIHLKEASESAVSLWLIVATVASLFIWTYWLVLPGLALQWWNEDQYGHGFVVPLFALGIVWHKREQLRCIRLGSAWSGLVLMVLSLATYATGIVGADLFLQRVSIVSMIAGVVLYVTGWRMFRCLAFPLAYLLLMIPLPGILFNSIAFPLQLLAAQLATDVMKVLAIPVYREGNVIHLAAAALDVEEACSGIRSLISLIAIGVPFAYFVEKRRWARVLLVFAVIPIAVVANVFRVTVTGLLAHYVSLDTALGLFHTIGGTSVFVLGTLLLFAFWLLLKAIKIGR